MRKKLLISVVTFLMFSFFISVGFNGKRAHAEANENIEIPFFDDFILDIGWVNETYGDFIIDNGVLNWNADRGIIQRMYVPISSFSGNFQLSFDFQLTHRENNIWMIVGLAESLTGAHDLKSSPPGTFIRFGWIGGGTPYSVYYVVPLAYYPDQYAYQGGFYFKYPSTYIPFTEDKWYHTVLEVNGIAWKLTVSTPEGQQVGQKTGFFPSPPGTYNYIYIGNEDYRDWPEGYGYLDNLEIRCNQAPVVDAGLDQIVEQETCEGTEVTQTGHVSDTDGDALTYQWTEGDTVLASGTVPAPNAPPTDADVTLTHIFPPGEHTVTLTVSDGETSSSDDVSIIVHDTVSPFSMLTTIPVAPGGLDGWFKSAVQVTITADDNGSGVKEIYHKKDSDTVFTIVQGNHAVFYPGDGTYTIEYYAKDKAGNEESFHNTYNFKVDTAAPGTAAAVQGNGTGNTYINHAAILLKAADAMSGVKEIHYIINGSETVVSNANATINLNQVGNYTIQYRAIDNAGNQEEHHSLQLKIISPRSGVVVIKNIIASLPNSAFAKNARNRRNALLNKLDQVITAIDSGQYPDAINKLGNDIGKKTDGCVTSGTADKNDWIVDCQAQSRLNTWINILVAVLTEMMNG
jgi:hypothetical protein